MLVLTRKNRESVVITRPEDLEIVLEITILEIEGGRVRLGFQADNKLPIHRREVWDRICNGALPNGEAVARSRVPSARDGAARDETARTVFRESFDAAPLEEAVRQAAMKAAAMRAATTVDGA